MNDNELIAEFMGFDVTDDGPIKGITIHSRTWKAPFGVKPYYGGFRGDQLHQFETSWDWLMPVVEKITPLSKQVGQQAWFDTGYFLLDGNIKVVYERTVQFIKWYNKTPHP